MRQQSPGDVRVVAFQGRLTACVKRVPETVPKEVARSNHFRLDQTAPVAKELADYDAIIK